MYKKLLHEVFLFTLAVLVSAGLCVAQSTESNQQGAKHNTKAAAKSMTVTGCLQKGDEANEYSITDNGKTYGLRSTKVDLSRHVGHQVSVTGSLRPEREEKEANESQEKNEQKEAGDIRVMKLKMIKDSCQ
jgi:hypothetical protein